MEQRRTFTKRREAGSENTWEVIEVDYSQLKQGIEIIKLIDIRDGTEHIATISNREDAHSINIVFGLDGNNNVGPFGDAINIVNAIIDYRGTIGVSLGEDGLLTSLDLKAFLYVERWKPQYQTNSLPGIGYRTPENDFTPEGSGYRNFSSLLMNSGDHISTLIIGSNENEYYLFDTSDNLHQIPKGKYGIVKANKDIYGRHMVPFIICLNKMPMPKEYGDAERSFKIQNGDCCMDWTMMFNAVIHEYNDINEIIMGRDTEQPFLNPEILEKTARRVALINENFIGPEYEELLQHLNEREQNLEMTQQQLNQRIPETSNIWRKTFNFEERQSSESSDSEYNPEPNKNKRNRGGRRR